MANIVSEKTIGNILLLQVDDNPAATGIDADIGSLSFIQGSAGLWQKTGLTATDWSIFGYSGITEHGTLSGLLDDDHPQYLLIELVVTAAAINSTLVANYTGGLVMIDGVLYSITAGNTTVGANLTGGYVYVNTSGTVTSGSSLPDGAVPLAQFTSNDTAITAITRKKAYLRQVNTPGANANISAVQPDASASGGSSERWARADHTHASSTATPASVGSSNAQGSSTTAFSKADHVHQGIHSLKALAGGTARYGDLVFLAGTNISISDDGAGNFTVGCTFSTSFGSPVGQVPDGGNVDGSLATAARSDHKHNIPTAAPSSIGTANAQGSSTTAFSKADHVHQGIHSLKALAGGTARYGDIVFLAGSNMSLSDDGVGNFTWAAALKQKAGIVAAGSFSLNPKKYTVTFTTAYADANYAISIMGGDARTWTVESVTASGFTINSNANTVLTASVRWITLYQGEYP